MELITITISKDLFTKLFKEGHIKSGEYDLYKVDVDNFDYSNNEKWEKAKAESNKAYKKRKQIEFEIRHTPKDKNDEKI